MSSQMQENLMTGAAGSRVVFKLLTTVWLRFYILFSCVPKSADTLFSAGHTSALEHGFLFVSLTFQPFYQLAVYSSADGWQ